MKSTMMGYQSTLSALLVFGLSNIKYYGDNMGFEHCHVSFF